MNSGEESKKSAWRRQAEILRKQFESIATQFLQESSGCKTIQVGVIDDSRQGREFNDASFSRVVDMALSRLSPSLKGVPCSMLADATTFYPITRQRRFVSNLPPRHLLVSPENKQLRRLSNFRNAMTASLTEGGRLLRTAPFSWPSILSVDEAGLQKEENERINWLSILFEASWGPAHAYGLQTGRYSAFDGSQFSLPQVVGEAQLIEGVSCPYDGVSPVCSYSISKDILRDSGRLIDWLLSLLGADESKHEPLRTAEQATKPKRGRRNGSTTSDPGQDQKIVNAWRNGKGQFASLAEVASAFETTKEEVTKALDRHRKRKGKLSGK